jgi:hypothetical protein
MESSGTTFEVVICISAHLLSIAVLVESIPATETRQLRKVQVSEGVTGR